MLVAVHIVSVLEWSIDYTPLFNAVPGVLLSNFAMLEKPYIWS